MTNIEELTIRTRGTLLQFGSDPQFHKIGEEYDLLLRTITDLTAERDRLRADVERMQRDRDAAGLDWFTLVDKLTAERDVLRVQVEKLRAFTQLKQYTLLISELLREESRKRSTWLRDPGLNQSVRDLHDSRYKQAEAALEILHEPAAFPDADQQTKVS